VATKRRTRKPRIVDFDSETDAFRSDWLKLTPGQRIVRAWKLRKRIKDLEAAHDAQSLPRL
jgi:hypothetical protein